MARMSASVHRAGSAAFVVAVAFGAVANAEQIASPYATGGEISMVETDNYVRYVHVFTNTATVMQFRNKSLQPLRGRILVVGAGGAGGYGLNSGSGGGGGGGGGGVLEGRASASHRVSAGTSLSARDLRQHLTHHIRMTRLQEHPASQTPLSA